MNDPAAAPIRSVPTILCAMDVQAHTANVAETDCACPDDYPDVTPITDIDLAVAYVLPDLHTDSLAERWMLAFNPQGHAGVVVLDQTAWTILSRFRQPRRLNEAIEKGDEVWMVQHGAMQLARLGLLQRIDRPAVTQPRTSQTLTAWLHMTNACNLRCDYCYLKKTPEAIDEVRGRKAIDAVIRSAVAHQFRRVKIKYAGGEATLNLPLIIALHQYARDCTARHGLTLDGVVLSNGVALGNRQICQIRDNGLRIMISLDGIGEMHNAQRRFANGQGSFSHVARTLDRLAQHGVTPSLSITLSHRNLKGLPETVAYVLERGLPFSLNFYRENDYAAGHIDLAFSEAEIVAAMKAAFAIIEQRLPPYRLDSLLDLVRFTAPHDHTCGAGHSYMVIDHYGRVAKCHMEIERVVADIDTPDPLALIRNHTSGIQYIPVDAKEGCRTCTWRYWCAGGCPALTFRMTGRFDIKSPNCRIYQTLFPEVLRLEGLRLLKYAFEQRSVTPSYV